MPAPPTQRRLRPRIGSREAMRFLMEAGQTLASTLEYERTLQALADLAVPRIACYCVVDIQGASGLVRRLGMAHVHPEQRVVLGTVTLPAPTGSVLLLRLLEAGEPQLVSPMTDDWLREAIPDEQELQQARRLATTSLILIPLAARGNALGVLVLGSTRTDSYYGSEDLVLARELGRIASVAIDNARLHRQAQDALRARDEVLRVVAHDLRNPVGTVETGAAFLLEEGPAELRDGRFGATLRAIRSSAERASRMIQDLLDATRIETGRLSIEPAPEPVALLLREAVELYGRAAQERGIELRCEAGAELPRVQADRERVLQVLGNLIGNALKFTPPGGRVEVAAQAEGDEVRIWVADTGVGIAPEHLSHLFDPYWQAQPDRRGLGLGLAIVRGLVEAHGGRTWAESTVGEGTQIHFTLPRAAKP
jgi:signal transduction histidine kinase